MSPEKSDGLLLYELYRGQIEHEDNQINQRLSWLFAANSFLFTAYTIGLTSSQGPPETLLQTVQAVGFLSTLLVGVSILAAITAIRRLVEEYETKSKLCKDESCPAIRVSYPASAFGLSAAVLLPPGMLIAWLVLQYRTSFPFLLLEVGLAVAGTAVALVRLSR